MMKMDEVPFEICVGMVLTGQMVLRLMIWRGFPQKPCHML